MRTRILGSSLRPRLLSHCSGSSARLCDLAWASGLVSSRQDRRTSRGVVVSPARIPRAGDERRGSPATSSIVVVRRGRRLIFCEVKEKRGGGFGDPARDGGRGEAAAAAAGGRQPGWQRSPGEPSRPDQVSFFDVIARSSDGRLRAAGRGFLSAASNRPEVAPTQDALYADIDLALSWSERDLPERERTKHVHRLHPYLGKFIPQLVEVLLGRYFRPGTARARSLRRLRGRPSSRRSRAGSTPPGVDVAAFNCLLMEVKTRDVRPVPARAGAARRARPRRRDLDRPYGRPPTCRRWFAPQAAARAARLPRARSATTTTRTCLRVVLARAARSARRTTHFDLDFPREPQVEPYWCHKHRRECRPVETAAQFLRRYTLDTLARLKEFSRVRVREGRRPSCTVMCGS